MPLAPAVAAALNVGLTANTKALWLDGVDVIKPGGGQGGVIPGSVRLTWAGPGQVSALVFDLDDPQKVFTPRIGQLVRFHNLTADLPLFLGWVADISPATVGIARAHTITCVGVEIMLDWMYVPQVVWSQCSIADAIRGLVAMATPIGAPSLNLASGTPAQGSTVATPISGPLNILISGNNCTSPAGSLRRAIEYVLGWLMTDTSSDPTADYNGTAVTVDRWGGLRCWSPLGGLATLSLTDHAAMTVSDSGSVKPSQPSAGWSGQDTPRGVYVKGNGVSLFVGDGTGVPGRVASITDPGTTLAAVQTAGRAYLARQGITLTGSTDIEGTQSMGTVAGNTLVDALSRLTFTDSSMGVTAADTAISKITITYTPSGEERWAVDFGAKLATGTAYLRALTQDQML